MMSTSYFIISKYIIRSLKIYTKSYTFFDLPCRYNFILSVIENGFFYLQLFQSDIHVGTLTIYDI